MWNSWFGLANIIFITVVESLNVYSYYSAIMTEPGRVPPGWRPEATEEEMATAQAAALASLTEKKREKKLGLRDPASLVNRLRYCTKCSQWKPPRAHHCSDCEHCVLRMDHHCPWIGNCVGHYNHKYFVLFLFYASLGLAYGVLSHIVGIVSFLAHQDKHAPFDVTVIFMVVSITIMFPLTMGLMSLLFWQLSLAWSNMTGIEDMYNDSAIRVARRENKKYFFPYDLGITQNLYAFFGSTVWMWFLPTKPSPGTGTSYKLNPNYSFHDA
ncbi:zinc finger protein, DHHC-type, palmitoyltransferase [Pelomyxa schiedti]|nr:zinc finger protein, DHHC-type, palmitoyltransferase [Pelomyxa schiedti]